MEKLRVLIYGYGRMGLTHFSILRSLNKNINFTIVEPNDYLRILLQKNLDANFLSNDNKISEQFDITLITTPPTFHIPLLKNCLLRNDKRIFIEKPFGGYSNIKLEPEYSNKEIFIGYVLRHNPCINWLKSNLDYSKIKSVHGQYLSNTIQKKPNGWRNSKYSGVLNEMGSHIIDLIKYLISSDRMSLKSSICKSIISDVDDAVKAELISDNGIDVSIDLNWVKKEIRKPIFNLKILMQNGNLFNVDQQIIKEYDKNNKIINQISVTDLSETVPYYLRGIDFTKQMQILLGNTKNLATIDEAISTNNIMNQIINYENNTRR